MKQLNKLVIEQLDFPHKPSITGNDNSRNDPNSNILAPNVIRTEVEKTKFSFDQSSNNLAKSFDSYHKPRDRIVKQRVMDYQDQR